MKKIMIKEKNKEVMYYLAHSIEETGMKILLRDVAGKLTGRFQSDNVESWGIVAE
jgi:hypothetical protein